MSWRFWLISLGMLRVLATSTLHAVMGMGDVPRSRALGICGESTPPRRPTKPVVPPPPSNACHQSPLSVERASEEPPSSSPSSTVNPGAVASELWARRI